MCVGEIIQRWFEGQAEAKTLALKSTSRECEHDCWPEGVEGSGNGEDGQQDNDGKQVPAGRAAGHTECLWESKSLATDAPGAQHGMRRGRSTPRGRG